MKNSMEHKIILKAILIKNRKLTLDEQTIAISELSAIIESEIEKIADKRRSEIITDYKLKEVK